MTINQLFPNIKSNKIVKGICSKICNIEENFIFINIDNNANLNNSIIDKGVILIISKIPISIDGLICLIVDNPLSEYIRLFNIINKTEQYNIKNIGIINDIDINVYKLINDSFNKFVRVYLIVSVNASPNLEKSSFNNCL